MHILLTDILTCPVCGPEHGLIVRTDQLDDRRIIEGAFGCPNCRRAFPVRRGVADLALDSGETTDSGDDAATELTGDSEAALRIAALLGLADAGGFALIAGPAAGHASEVARLADRFEIIADASHSPAGPVSRMRFGGRLPFYNDRLRGIWLAGQRADTLLEEAARVLHPLGRLVLEPSPAHATSRLGKAGLGIRATQDRTVLATKA